jgi:hypothetical protein
MMKTKHLTQCWLVMAMVISLLLSACTATNDSTSTTAATTQRATELALGTVGLEGTTQAVDAAAAAQLLPMWQLFSDLRNSTTAAPEELAATVTAIEAAMTPDQLAAIAAMDFSYLRDNAAGQAGPARGGQTAAAGNAEVTSVMMDPALAGEMGAGPGGGMPMDAMGPPDSAGSASRSLDQSLAGGATANGGPGSGALQSVIELLEAKVQQA